MSGSWAPEGVQEALGLIRGNFWTIRVGFCIHFGPSSGATKSVSPLPLPGRTQAEAKLSFSGLGRPTGPLVDFKLTLCRSFADIKLAEQRPPPRTLQNDKSPLPERPRSHVVSLLGSMLPPSWYPFRDNFRDGLVL